METVLEPVRTQQLFPVWNHLTSSVLGCLLMPSTAHPTPFRDLLTMHMAHTPVRVFILPMVVGPSRPNLTDMLVIPVVSGRRRLTSDLRILTQERVRITTLNAHGGNHSRSLVPIPYQALGFRAVEVTPTPIALTEVSLDLASLSRLKGMRPVWGIMRFFPSSWGESPGRSMCTYPCSSSRGSVLVPSIRTKQRKTLYPEFMRLLIMFNPPVRKLLRATSWSWSL